MKPPHLRALLATTALVAALGIGYAAGSAGGQSDQLASFKTAWHGLDRHMTNLINDYGSGKLTTAQARERISALMHEAAVVTTHLGSEKTLGAFTSAVVLRFGPIYEWLAVARERLQPLASHSWTQHALETARDSAHVWIKQFP